MSAPKCVPIHPMDVEIFQSGLKQCTDQLTITGILRATLLAKNFVLVKNLNCVLGMGSFLVADFSGRAQHRSQCSCNVRTFPTAKVHLGWALVCA